MFDHIIKLKIPPAVITLVTAGIMWGIDWMFHDQWLEFEGRLWTAAGFLGVGGFLGLLGLVQFYSHSTTINPHKPDTASTLIQTGIYRISRNPMYLGLLAILIAWGLYLGSLLPLLMLFGFTEYMNRYQIFPEEQVLARKFGKSYLNYKKRTNRWL